MVRKKRPLDELLKEMDEYDWDKVPDLFKHEKYEKIAPVKFAQTLEEAKVTLKGSVLDVCSGQVSLASIYDDVVCFDLPEEMIKELRKKGIRAVMGDIVDGLPFEDESFDYVFAAGIPLMPYKRTDAPQDSKFSKKYVPTELRNPLEYVENFVDETIRVAKKKIIIESPAVVMFLPQEHRGIIERLTDSLIVYNKK